MRLKAAIVSQTTLCVLVARLYRLAQFNVGQEAAGITRLSLHLTI